MLFQYGIQMLPELKEDKNLEEIVLYLTREDFPGLARYLEVGATHFVRSLAGKLLTPYEDIETIFKHPHTFTALKQSLGNRYGKRILEYAHECGIFALGFIGKSPRKGIPLKGVPYRVDGRALREYSDSIGIRPCYFMNGLLDLSDDIQLLFYEMGTRRLQGSFDAFGPYTKYFLKHLEIRKGIITHAESIRSGVLEAEDLRPTQTGNLLILPREYAE